MVATLSSLNCFSASPSGETGWGKKIPTGPGATFKYVAFTVEKAGNLLIIKMRKRTRDGSATCLSSRRSQAGVAKPHGELMHHLAV